MSLEANYYSPLVNWGLAKIRQFVNFNYTAGVNRFNTIEERLDISNEGIRGVRSDSLKGVRKLVLNVETVLFSRASIAGFRIAPYLFVSFLIIVQTNITSKFIRTLRCNLNWKLIVKLVLQSIQCL